MRRHQEDCSLISSSLPHHLMGLIIDKSDRETTANMRLVSKAWHAAVREHPMSPKPIEINSAGDVGDLCEMMPNMPELVLRSEGESINLRPLSGLSRLTHLRLTGSDSSQECKEPAELRAKISDLPSSLRVLQLWYIDVCTHNLKSLAFVSLKILSFRFRWLSHPAVWKLLKHLPNLEVILRTLPLTWLQVSCGILSV